MKENQAFSSLQEKKMSIPVVHVNGRKPVFYTRSFPNFAEQKTIAIFF